MRRIKYFISVLRIEEHILFFFILIFWAIFYFTYPLKNWATPFKIGLENIWSGLVYFSYVFLFFYFYLFYRLFLFFGEKITSMVGKRLSFFQPFSFKATAFLPKFKQILAGLFPLLRLLFFIAIFFQIIATLLGILAISLRERLIDNYLLEMDKFLFGVYPFIWFQGESNFVKIFERLFVYSFVSLGLVLGTVFIVFYLAQSRKFLSQYIMAIIISLAIALPLWYFFPANSPQNSYLNNVYSKETDSQITGNLKNYQPTSFVAGYQEKFGVKPGGTAPISTMPSMHVAWSTIVVYLTYRFKKKLTFIFLPWAIFSSIGTVYLAQHYFIDGLVSVPIGIISVWLADFFFSIENKYYKGKKQDENERGLKNQIRKDLKNGYTVLKESFTTIFSSIKKI